MGWIRIDNNKMTWCCYKGTEILGGRMDTVDSLALRARRARNRRTGQSALKARLKVDDIFHIKPPIEGLLQIDYPSVALSALALLFAFYLGLRYGPKPAFACPRLF